MLICKLCGGIKFTLVSDRVFDTRFGIDEEYEILQCQSCDFVFTNMLLSSDELKYFYEAYYNFGGEKDTLYSKIREIFLTSWLYKFWMAIDGDISFHGLRGRGRLLDVGCNEGRGLAIYKRNGFNAEGLELNEHAAAEARKRGFTVHSELIENFKPQCLYDVVILSNVLEHVLDPLKILENLNLILVKKGEIWISFPNEKSWLRHFFEKKWINWHVPFHISHFSESTAKKVLEASGFEIVSMKNKTPALWVSHSIIASLFSKKGVQNKRLRNPFLILTLMMIIRGILWPILVLGNLTGHGDCLVLRARKI